MAKTIGEIFGEFGMTRSQISEAVRAMKSGADSFDIDDDLGCDSNVDVDDSEPAIGEGFQRLKSLMARISQRKKNKLYRKTSSGRQAYKRQLMKSKTSSYKRKEKIHNRKLRAAGGPRKGQRFLTTAVESVGAQEGLIIMSNKLLESVERLARAVNRDGSKAFREFVEAFNHVADIGELGAMKLLDEDEDAASDVIELSLRAESVLKRMETMGGTLTEEQESMLEATLADAMDMAGDLLSEHNLIESMDDDSDEEDYDEIDEDDDLEEDYLSDVDDDGNPFHALANQMREARGNRKVVRPSKGKMLTAKGMKTRSGKSKWAKSNTAPGASKKQVSLRGDVQNKQALLGYLRQVKLGKVAPGQPLSKNRAPVKKGAPMAGKKAASR